LATDKLLEVNNKNLTLLALKFVDKKTLDKYILYLAKSKYGIEYYKHLTDKTSVDKLIYRVENELKNKLLNVSTSSKYLFSYDSNLNMENIQSSTVKIKSFAHIPQKSIMRYDNLKDGLPDHFDLLFANIDILSKVQIHPQTLKTYLTKDKNMETKIFVELILILNSYQNDKNFQTIISEVKVYDSPRKKYLLASIKEQQSTKEIVKKLFLKDGITNKLIGIHAFSFLGYRLQDQLIESKKLNDYCTKRFKNGINQVIICKMKYTDNSALVITYLGGIVAQIDLIAIGKLNPNEIIKIKKAILISLKRSKNMFSKFSDKWTKYKVDFEFYSDALVNKKNIESTYIYPDVIEFNSTVNTYTLIVTMMSKATKKLLGLENES
jgi:hypothetical protein